MAPVTIATGDGLKTNFTCPGMRQPVGFEPFNLHLPQKKKIILLSQLPRTLAGSSSEGHWPTHSQTSSSVGVPGLGWDTLIHLLTPEEICQSYKSSI